MGRSLVIVESPAKAKTINKYLGKEFVVKSCVGHVRDLPVSGSGSKKPVDPKQRAKEAAKTRKMPADEKAEYKKKKAHTALIDRMGIDPDKDWKADYHILPGKEKVVNELKQLAEKADTIYLATDLDREGEAIAWHLKEVIGGDDDRYLRVVFNEITKTAIADAFSQPEHLNIARVQAQQTRRFLDRIVGYMVSPLLWAKIARGLSAGRVQSVAVRILVEREREIRAFIPEEYWELFADTNRKDSMEDALRFQVVKQNGENFRPTNEAETSRVVDLLKGAEYKIAARDDRPTRTKPSAPFITSTLQQAASTRMGFTVKKTMMLAQRLYEAGHITYMRTDSTNLSQEALDHCRSFIEEKYGDRYLPEEPIRYSNKDGAQEAHEAIRPTDVEKHWSGLSDMEPDAQRLYELIWRRFVACQMPPAEYLSTTLKIMIEDFELRTRGRILQFDGYLKAQPPYGKKGDEDRQLPDIKVGEVLALSKLDPKQHFTKPPARFSEAALVKELEKRGIGRPSTYAAIISTIQDRGYARLENRRFYAEKIGEIVTDRLNETFESLMDYSFTAKMEEQLDDISHGEVGWKAVLNDFYKDFKKKLDHASDEEAGMRPNAPVEIDIECSKCERPMQIRNASTGVFLGCSGYALPPKERCKNTVNLIPGEEATIAGKEDDLEELEIEQLRHKRRCPICSTAMESYLIDEGRKLHVCGNNPDCVGYELELGSFKIKGYDGPVLECDKCGSDMQLKSGRFGKYFGCTNEECSNTRKLLRNGEPAPPKADPIPMPHLRCEKSDDFFLLRDGASGIFLAASQFPKHRETRAPFVEEVASVKDQLDPKLLYLAEAPLSDPEGNPTIVRYLRKTKEQYVMTENAEGKATGWRAYYVDGSWKEDASKASKGGKKAKSPAKGKSASKSKSPAKAKKPSKKSSSKKTAGGSS